MSKVLILPSYLILNLAEDEHKHNLSRFTLEEIVLKWVMFKTMESVDKLTSEINVLKASLK